MDGLFRKPHFSSGIEIIRHDLSKDSVLVCLYCPSMKLGASLVVSSKWEAEDTAALKMLIREFSTKVSDGLSLVLAKLIGPKETLDRLEFLFKKSGIRTVARRDTSIQESSEALFYGSTGRLRVAF